MIDSHVSGLGAKAFKEKLNMVDVTRKKTPVTRITKNEETFLLSMRQLQIKIENLIKRLSKRQLNYSYSLIAVSAVTSCPTISHIIFGPPT